jgi:hypothetical protein
MEQYKNIPLPEPEKYIHYLRYQKFINSRPDRDLKKEKGYCLHHILPRSLGGCDNNNLIKLTTREHFIAHLILWKCGYIEMMYSFLLITNTSKSIGKLTSRQYNTLCEEYSIRRSIEYSGEGNPFFHKKRPDHSKKMSDKNNPMYGKDWRIGKTKEELEHHRESCKKRVGDKNSFYNKKHSSEIRSKISKSIRRLYDNGFISPMKGKHFSEESKKKLSESWKGKVLSEDKRRRITESHPRGATHPRARKIFCLETNEKFDYIQEAVIIKNISRSSIYKSICNKQQINGLTFIYLMENKNEIK